MTSIDARPLRSRRVHIAGSASGSCSATLLRHAHELVRCVVPKILGGGGRLVSFVGKEDKSKDGLPLVFYWTLLDRVAAWTERHGAPDRDAPPLVTIVTSEKARSEIPPERRALWDALLSRRVVHAEALPPGWRSGALVRIRQVKYANVLVTISGGAGVEHLAQLHGQRGNPVIPLDFDLGSSRDERGGGGYELARTAKADASPFFELRSGSSTARLLELEIEPAHVSADESAERVVSLIRDLVPPRAFYVRVMNREIPEFASVERFFRGVVDPVIDAAGYERLDLSVDPSRSPYLNREIFERLHRSALAVVDFTGTRENAFMEGGYSFGRQMPVLLMAAKGTKLPFDPAQLACHFWEPGQTVEEAQRALRAALHAALVRPPLVE